MLTKDTAICIRALDYSETSQIVTLFTRTTGKIGAIAKGSKRPKSAFDGPLEVFSYGEIVFSDSSREKLATLTEFQQKPGFADLANNLFALNCCLFGAELVNSLTNEYDPHPELFDGFLRFLQDASERRLSAIACLSSVASAKEEAAAEATSDEQRDLLSLLILFQLVLLREIGLMPILNACANCKTQYAIRNTQYEAYFSSSANGLICRDCEASFPDKIILTKNAANCLANAKLIAETSEKTLNEIEKILIHHFTGLLHKPPKMAKYVLKTG